MIKNLILIVILSIVHCSAQVWEEPYIIDLENDAIIISNSAQTFVIDMNEEIEFPYALCLLNFEGMIKKKKTKWDS